MNISASIVLYNSDPTLINELVKSLHFQKVNKVYLIDNSLSNNGLYYTNLINCEYIHNPSNPGFGASHNVGIHKANLANAKYHFIINPDIVLGENVIKIMMNYITNNQNIGLMMPKLLNTDGTIQHLPKLLPSPISIFRRKIKWNKYFLDRYELRNVPQNQIYNCPIISGCFTLLNLEIINIVGGYDESFFMYFEDFDLSRRVHKKYKTLYFPGAFVTHGYDSGANKNIKLLFAFITSAIKYFNKWGWFFDKERARINKSTFNQFN
jgi:GT2 family glycosyltransferase